MTLDRRQRNLRSAPFVMSALCLLALQSAVAADAEVVLEPRSGSSARGHLRIAPQAQGVRITGEVSGLTPGPHGFHIHALGDCSAPDAESAGGHFNPGGKRHGGLKSAERHAGDLGNIQANASGVAKVDVTSAGLSTAAGRADSIRGRALVVHAQSDDEKSDPAGNSGARVACGVIPK